MATSATKRLPSEASSSACLLRTPSSRYADATRHSPGRCHRPPHTLAYPSARHRHSPRVDRDCCACCHRGTHSFYGLGRIIRQGHPSLFDEKHYVPQAWQMLHNHAMEFNPGYGLVVHPPLGKQLIALSEAVLGYNPWGWRVSSAIAGVICVILIVRIGRRLSGSTYVGALAGTLLICDGMFTAFREPGYSTFSSSCLSWPHCSACCSMEIRWKTECGQPYGREQLLPVSSAPAGDSAGGASPQASFLASPWRSVVRPLLCGCLRRPECHVGCRPTAPLPCLPPLGGNTSAATLSLLLLPSHYSPSASTSPAGGGGSAPRMRSTAMPASRMPGGPLSSPARCNHSGTTTSRCSIFTRASRIPTAITTHGNPNHGSGSPVFAPCSTTTSQVSSRLTARIVATQKAASRRSFCWAPPSSGGWELLCCSGHSIVSSPGMTRAMSSSSAAISAAWIPWLLNWDRQMYFFYASSLLPFICLGLALMLSELDGWVPETPSPEAQPWRHKWAAWGQSVLLGRVIVCVFMGLVIANYVWILPILYGVPISPDLWRLQHWLPTW